MSDRTTLIRRLVTAVHADHDVPGDQELRDATANAGTQIVDQLLAQLRDGPPLAGFRAPPAAIVYAHEYAHRGIELPVLLAVVRIGYAEFASQWSERLTRAGAASRDSIEALSASLLEIFGYIDSISTAFAVAYSEERQRWSRSIEAQRLDLVRAILAGQPVEPSLAEQRLGHRLDARQRAFICWSDGDPALGLEAAAAALVSRAGASGALLVPLSGQVLAGWIGGSAADLDLAGEALHVHAAFGRAGDGIAGFRSSHHQAQHARRVARSAGLTGVTSYADVALIALASADLEHAREFVAAELGPLAAASRIAPTVAVFLEEGRSRTRTARRLGLHTNTIAYRLARAAELLGHGLDERSAEVQVALALAPLVADSATGPKASTI
jgi:hypothetical protein